MHAYRYVILIGQKILLEQELSNVLLHKNYVKAFRLAVQLNQVMRRHHNIILTLTSHTACSPLCASSSTSLSRRCAAHIIVPFVTWQAKLPGVLRELGATDLVAVLGFIRDWNTNARHW